MKRDVRTVAGWDFERIIPCHGVRASAADGFCIAIVRLVLTPPHHNPQDVIEKEGKAAWKAAYGWYLQ